MTLPTENLDNLDQGKLLSSIHDRITQLETALTAIGYDAKAAKKRRFPSKRQSSVINGITRALCVETIDPWCENRVRFYHPLLHDPNTNLQSLPFANPVSTLGGFDDCGVSWVPPAGSTIVIFFEGGARDAAFYLGTTWQRDRGPGGSEVNTVFISREWNAIHANNRAGNFLHGPDDGSQCLPPWNTENQNAGDITQIEQFTEDPLAQKRATYAHIYGIKTPGKHMIKMDDGDAKCNNRWKRFELMTGDGIWMCMKDDHIHYGGQWSHPDCGGNPASSSDLSVCTQNDSARPFFTDIQGEPLEKGSDCGADCDGAGDTQCSQVLGGHSSTPCDPDTKYCDSQVGTNRFFKQRNECRPYRGPGTPQNNRCDLPQSGFQILTLSGISMVMDDSVEEPRGHPGWQRANEPFDFGCNDKYLGRYYVRSGTGHSFMMSDVEDLTALRGNKNFIRLRSASGNRFEMNDHTVGEASADCPPNYAGDQRGITLQSTSSHVFKMIDHMNLQCSPKRQEGGTPVPNATKAYIQVRSGYGLEMRFNDDSSQQDTQQQWIQITHPQCVSPDTDSHCNSCDTSDCRGPHFLRFQGRPKGQPGVVFLRAGGHSIRQTYDMDIVLVGDKERNPADKFTYVSKKHFRVSEGVDFRYSGELHILFAEKQILLMAGRDCPPPPGKKCKGPCLYPVIIGRCPVICPLTGILHWTEKAMSERVFASGYNPCQTGCGGDCSEYDQKMAKAQGAPCKEDTTTNTLSTGSGSGDQQGGQQVQLNTSTGGDPNQSATAQ